MVLRYILLNYICVLIIFVIFCIKRGKKIILVLGEMIYYINCCSFSFKIKDKCCC